MEFSLKKSPIFGKYAYMNFLSYRSFKNRIELLNFQNLLCVIEVSVCYISQKKNAKFYIKSEEATCCPNFKNRIELLNFGNSYLSQEEIN